MPDPTAIPRPTLRFRVIAWLVIAVVRLFRVRLRTSGIEHVPSRGGAVITWNHHSHVDFVVTVYDIYCRLGRPVRFVAKRELWDHRWLGWVPRFADAIPVSRADDGDRDRALSSAVEALQAGHLVMVAPEGGITESLELGSFRTGAVRMAQLAGVPVVPSVSWGSQRVSTTGHPLQLRRVWRLPVEVDFGPPIQPVPGDEPVAITRQVRDRMADMLHDTQARYPDGAPPGAWWVPARLGGAAPPSDPDRPEIRRRPEDAA